MTEAIKGTTKIYACGGAGINVAKVFEPMRGKITAMFSVLDICYLDTSPANLQDPTLPRDSIYRIPGVNGSGQVRKENAEKIFAHAPQMLEKHRPAKNNIVIHSLSGGSGSVIGPALVAEMLAAGESVVVITIGEDDTVKHMENTHMSIMSYMNIAAQNEKPVIAAYFQNSNLTPEADVNKGINQLVTALTVLYSGENIGMDERDLFNWLNFNAVTRFGPQLSLLSVFEGTDVGTNIGDIISVVTLATTDGPSAVGQLIEYQKVGRLPVKGDEADSPVHMSAPIHFVTSDGIWGDVFSKLDTQLADYNRKAAARVPQLSQSELLKKGPAAAKNGVMV